MSVEEATVQLDQTKMIFDALKLFQEELKIMHAKNEALETAITSLNTKVNTELPAYIEGAFKEIQQNFGVIGNAIRQLNEKISNPLVTTGPQPQQKQGGMMGLFENILEKINLSGAGATGGGLTDMDKQILQASKQIQLLNLKDVLKKTAKSAGVELADHIVVTE